jgi:hypothetical protein
VEVECIGAVDHEIAAAAPPRLEELETSFQPGGRKTSTSLILSAISKPIGMPKCLP